VPVLSSEREALESPKPLLFSASTL
jgi:hypothetical protein